MLRRIPRALRLVVVLVAVLGFYFVLLGARGISLLGDPRWIVRGLGVGVLLLPVVGVAIVAQELRFGAAAQRLGEQLDAEAIPPGEEFAARKAEVEAAPDSWRAWYLLGVAYGEAGDVPRGRRAVRRAIALERRSGRQQTAR